MVQLSGFPLDDTSIIKAGITTSLSNEIASSNQLTSSYIVLLPTHHQRLQKDSKSCSLIIPSINMLTNVETGAMDSPTIRRARSSSSVSTCSSTTSLKSKASQRKSSSLPPETVEYLKAWMMSPDHVAHPYPTEQEKTKIMADTSIELKQLTNWFVNNRKRFWKPRVEARLQQRAQVVAVATAVSVAHVVSPGGERPNFTVVQQQVETPYLTLDMTQPATTQQQTPSYDCRPTMVPSEGFSVFPSAASHAVSDASSAGSDENGSEDDSNEEMDNEVTDEVDETTGTVTRTESVDIHILRPIAGGIPTIEDVTILSSVPTSRIIRSYRSSMMAYSFPETMTEERKKVSNTTSGLY